MNNKWKQTREMFACNLAVMEQPSMKLVTVAFADMPYLWLVIHVKNNFPLLKIGSLVIHILNSGEYLYF